jgi:hypothetical protein
MVEVARKIAESAHTGQKRKDGSPYISHPIRVSEMIQHLGEDYVCTALLHDVLEDSEYTFADLQHAGFDPKILTAVAFLTKTKGESYLDYIIEIKALGGSLALEVKRADLRDNLVGANGTLRDKYMMALYILETAWA